MLCPNCKKEIENGSTFCEYCGKQVNNSANSQNAQNSTTPKRNRTWILWSIISILAIFTCILGFLFFEVNHECNIYADQLNRLQEAVRLVYNPHDAIWIDDVRIDKTNNALYIEIINLDQHIAGRNFTINIFTSSEQQIYSNRVFFSFPVGWSLQSVDDIHLPQGVYRIDILDEHNDRFFLKTVHIDI